MFFMLLTKGVISKLIATYKFILPKTSVHNQARRNRQTVALPSWLNMAASGRVPALLPSGFFWFGGEVV